MKEYTTIHLKLDHTATSEEKLFTEVLKIAFEDVFFIKNKPNKGMEKYRSELLFESMSGKYKQHFEFLCLMAGINSKSLREKYFYYKNNPEKLYLLFKKNIKNNETY